ncbi:MAG: ribonuclease III [bacterium]
MEECDNLEELQSRLGYVFKDISLLENALTHKSYINEAPDKEKIKDNERLEFLGDAVLGLVISDFLIKKFPDYSEGALSRLKGFIVSETFLFEIAKELELGRHLILGRGEENSGGRRKRSILADASEAVLAGIYLDGGLECAYTFILKHMEEKVIEIANNAHVPEYKTILQEYTQYEFGCVPTYKVVSEKGEDHSPEFEVSIFIENKLYGKGKGRSKRKAEQNAAYNALLNMDVDGI